MHLKITLSRLRCDPGDLHNFITGATGHSQGIVVAAMASAVTSRGSFFTAGAEQALRILLYIGVRGQQSFRHVESSSAASEYATPMMSIRGLPYKELEALVEEVNESLTKVYATRYARSMSLRASRSLDHPCPCTL